MKKFDLNIEEILDDWEIYHGIREIIANALDEQILTNTKDVEIFEVDSGKWHIRDYGRGLQHKHFTQKEDEEKLNNSNMIGKFGIGLKDAIGTFFRNGVEVLIKSKFGDFTIDKFEKHGFEEIKTIHVIPHPATLPDLQGTEVILENISKNDIIKAKALFLIFSGEKSIESTDFGDVYKNKGNQSNIYINGVKVAEEENFLYSYNITSITKKIREALNRERSNVGKNAYRDRVIKILTSCKSEEVIQVLTRDLEQQELGESHDELNWTAVEQHAISLLSSKKEVIFVTSQQIQESFSAIDDAKERGLQVVTVKESASAKIKNKKDISGKQIRDITYFHKEESKSFEFKYIHPKDLSNAEKIVYNLTEKIFKLIGGRPSEIKNIKISETMRKDPNTYREVNGLWNGIDTITVKRSTLNFISRYAGTLIHETAHCISGEDDLTRKFELELTRLLGILTSKLLSVD